MSLRCSKPGSFTSCWTPQWYEQCHKNPLYLSQLMIFFCVNSGNWLYNCWQHCLLWECRLILDALHGKAFNIYTSTCWSPLNGSEKISDIGMKPLSHHYYQWNWLGGGKSEFCDIFNVSGIDNNVPLDMMVSWRMHLKYPGTEMQMTMLLWPIHQKIPSFISFSFFLEQSDVWWVPHVGYRSCLQRTKKLSKSVAAQGLNKNGLSKVVWHHHK